MSAQTVAQKALALMALTNDIALLKARCALAPSNDAYLDVAECGARVETLRRKWEKEWGKEP